MARYSVLLRFTKPNSSGSSATKWFTVEASSSSSTKSEALAQARSQNPDYQWSVAGEPRQL